MEKKSNGKVIFITALISVITTLVLVIGSFFAFQMISNSNSMDGYYEVDDKGDYYNIEIKDQDAIVTWRGDNYTGQIHPNTETIKLSGGKELKYTFKFGKMIIEDDNEYNEKGEQVIFDKKDREKAIKERKEQREKEEAKEEKRKSSSSDDD